MAAADTGRRVAITGCGVVTPAGCELESFWASLMRGECHIGPLKAFAVRDFETLYGAEVTLPPQDALPADVDTNAGRARCLELALAAVRRAVTDAGLPRDAALRERTGAVIGTTLGEERQVGDLSERWAAEGAGSIDAGFFARSASHRLATVAAAQHGLGGPVMLTAAACSSGNAAIATAYDLIRMGAADCMIAGAADTLVRSIYCGFFRMGALSKSVCRPYDKHRDGVSFGEGAGVVVLEDLEAARRRGARVYAEVAGFGVSNDAHHITAPDPSGNGFMRAIRQALATTGTAESAVDYVSAHGTGTLYSDLCEVRALHGVFGERARTLPMSSIKSMIGHTNGAASAIEAVACALAIAHQAVPPTANLTEQDPECAIDCVPGKGRALKVETCLNLSAGFGGFNACLVIRKASS
jgi:3-oxoacyl-[acyl-carrier-protein] synthase II